MGVDKINSWLTLTANLGVVVGLIFLGIELQQTRLATEAETIQTRFSEIQESTQNFALSDYLPEIYDKLEAEGFSALNSIEIRRVRAWELAKATRMQAQFEQYNLGFLDERAKNGMLQAAASNLELWNSLGINVEPIFLEAINTRPID